MPFQRGHQSPAKWQKGQSPNPGGRPRGFKELQELARSHAPDAIVRLVEIMAGQAFTFTRLGMRISVPVSPLLQLQAAVAILERGYGKPVQPLSNIADSDSQAVQLQRIERVIVHLDDKREPQITRLIEHDAEDIVH